MLSIYRYNTSSEDHAIMELATSIGYLLQHTVTILQRQFDHVLQQELSIGMAQFKILMILQKTPHAQQSKLAESLGQTEASISRQIKVLVERGFLTTDVDPHSHRTHIASVTATGLEVAHKAMNILQRSQEPMLDLLSEEQKQELINCLRIMHSYACVAGKPFACDHPFNI